MSEEKKLPQATITVEYDGETQVFHGHAFELTVVGDDMTDGRSEGYVNMAEAINFIECLGRHIGRAASTNGISGGVAEAMAADGINKQMKKDWYEGLLGNLEVESGHTLGEAFKKFVEIKGSEQKES